MSVYYADDHVELHQGNCVELMAAMPGESVDAIVTDPPYGLEFMGAHWDKLDGPNRRGHNYSAFDEGPNRSRLPTYLAGPNPTCRTCGGLKYLATEGSGGRSKCQCDVPDFPNYSLGASRAMQAWHEAWARQAFAVLKPGGHLLAFGGTRTVHRLTSALEDAGFEIRDQLVWAYASGMPKSIDVGRHIDMRACTRPGRHCMRAVPPEPRRQPDDHVCPVAPAGAAWGGWGTALKPAWEPIIMARRPLHSSVAGNVERYGTGALNIDDNRLPIDEADREAIENMTGYGRAGYQRRPQTPASMMRGTPIATEADGSKGRWPANVVATDPVLGEYSRFFLIPKASRSDREPAVRGQLPERTVLIGAEGHAINPMTGPVVDIPRENSHPTVKPVELMQHLVRLVTPRGGTVLDPFLGSGSTAKAASLEGVRCIGIELDSDYLAIATARLVGLPIGLGL